MILCGSGALICIGAVLMQVNGQPAKECTATAVEVRKRTTRLATAARLIWKQRLVKQTWLEPILANSGVVIVPSESFQVFGLSADSGKVLWTFHAESTGNEKGFVSGPVTDDEGRAFVGAKTHAAYALDSRTGRLLWMFRAPSHVVGLLPYGAASILVCSADGSVYALSRLDGSEEWRTRIRGPLRNQPVRTAGLAVLATREGTVVGLNLTNGEIVWSRELGIGTRWGALTVGKDGAVVLTTDQNRAFILNGRNGDLLLEITFPETAEYKLSGLIDGKPLLLGSGSMLFAGRDASLHCYERNGRLKWTSFLGLERHNVATRAGSPALLDSGHIVVAGGHEGVVIVDAFTGNVKWRGLPGTWLTTPVHVASDRQFYFGSGDTIFAFACR